MTIRRRLRPLMFGLVVTVLLLGVGRAVHAQQAPPPAIAVAAAGQLQELVLSDGTRVVGRVEKIENGRVTFRTEAGAVLEVAVAQVVSASIVTGRLVGGTYWPEDSNPTRLFFAPTGRTLKRGESYFGLYEIWMPFVQYGITDRFSIGGGTPLFLGEGVSHPFWFTPKFQVLSRPKTQVSIGAMHFLNIDDENPGVAYAAVTQGSTDDALTVGVGWGYSKGNIGSAVLMLGGEHRLSRRTKFVTENYLIEGHGLISGGFRFMGERLSADLGLVAPVDADYFMVFPMFNFVWKLGK